MNKRRKRGKEGEREGEGKGKGKEEKGEGEGEGKRRRTNFMLQTRSPGTKTKWESIACWLKTCGCMILISYH